MFSIITLFGFVLWILYRIWTSAYSYWESRGFPAIPGSFPLGSKSNLTLLKYFQGFTWEEVYRELAPYPYGGLYVLRNPLLLIRDPEIIKLVLVKEFPHFRNRHGFSRKTEKLAQHLFNLEDETWRSLRIKLTPTFSSGKLKAMFPLFVSCCESLKALLLRLESEIDVKDITSRFSTDIIGTCAFGLDFNSLNERDSRFRHLGVEIFKTNARTKLKMAFINTFPLLTHIFVPRFISEKVEEFLFKMIKDTIDFREKTGLKRNDFLDLLIQLRNQDSVMEESLHSTEMNLEMIAAQCFVFFTAGFETSSSVQSFCLYELALNPEIQERLADEIYQVLKTCNSITYKAVKNMNYLDMVVSETIRKYPTFPILTRRCTKRFVLPDGHVIEKGTKLIIPLWALHRDPNYFPDPERFDPERFSPERRVAIKPFTYLPFGEGPRICIGVRFGLLQTKMGLITILRHFRVETSESTAIPVRLAGSGLITTTDPPIQLRLTKRTTNIS